MTTTLPGGITILHVLHASGVAAIPDASGPRALLEAGLAETLGSRGLPVRVIDIDLPPDGAAGEVGRAFTVADRVARAVRDAAARGELAVVLSGSCHVGLGALSGIPADRRGVLWFDAHGDINTPETTGSGLLDGTVLGSRANAYALDGGLSADELGSLVRLAARECPVRALGIASYDPATDTEGGVRRAALAVARALADALANGDRAHLATATRSA